MESLLSLLCLPSRTVANLVRGRVGGRKGKWDLESLDAGESLLPVLVLDDDEGLAELVEHEIGGGWALHGEVGWVALLSLQLQKWPWRWWHPLSQSMQGAGAAGAGARGGGEWEERANGEGLPLRAASSPSLLPESFDTGWGALPSQPPQPHSPRLLAYVFGVRG